MVAAGWSFVVSTLLRPFSVTCICAYKYVCIVGPQTQGISVRSYYQDFDRNCMGFVTRSQVTNLYSFVCMRVSVSVRTGLSDGQTELQHLIALHFLDPLLIFQFHRSFPGPSEVSESDIDLLAARYYDPSNGLCNYMKFNADIKSIWEGGRKTVTFVPSAPAPPVCLRIQW